LQVLYVKDSFIVVLLVVHEKWGMGYSVVKNQGLLCGCGIWECLEALVDG
jgi:hypothetical protein